MAARGEAARGEAARGDAVDLTAFRTVRITNNTEGLKDELLKSLDGSDDDQLNMITDIIVGDLSHGPSWYSTDLDRLVQYLLNPFFMCCIEHHLKNNRGRIADLILSYIFIVPTSHRFSCNHVTLATGVTTTDTWKIRDEIPKELHGLVFKLMDICLCKDTSDDTSFEIPPLGVLPKDVFEYINTTWLEQNQTLVKSSIKK